MPTEIVVGPGECRLAGRGDVLRVRHLATGWAIALHHSAAQIGVLARFDSEPDPAIREAAMATRSLAGARRGWRAYVVGGAMAPGDEAAARAVHSGQLAIHASLWREGVLVEGEDAGGERARSMYFDPAAGRFIVRSAGTLAPAVPTIALPCPLAS